MKTIFLMGVCHFLLNGYYSDLPLIHKFEDNMKRTIIQDILPFVEKPSRYLGGEINSIKKDPEKVRLRFALAFPDLYEIGMSHFGIQILYHVLNLNENIGAERFFAPGTDMEDRLKKSSLPIFSLESGRPIYEFDIIGFSLLYELNYTNILTMLDLGNIPFLASERDENHPFVIAGGPCVCNPEPVADFFDAMVLGDGEKVIMEMAYAWLEWKKEQGNKNSLLKIWSEIEGVYIPSFFDVKFTKEGFQKTTPKFSGYKEVRRTILQDLDSAPFPGSPVIPFGKPVHDRLRLELARGCTRGCRFCQAGMIYRPVRERPLSSLLSLAECAISSTGYEDISLLSLSTGDYTAISLLIKELMTEYQSRHIAISLPSLRAGTLTPQLMELIKKVRKTGFTIAPEAGSQRLRNIINKNITEEDIFTTVRDAFRAGWQIIKLYFMSGLPFETGEDIMAICNLVKELKAFSTRKSKRAKINVSLGTFVPKPHTPFQWSPQLSLDQSGEKIQFVKQNLAKLRGIHFKWQKPQSSVIEGVFSRGDRSLSRLIISAYEKGCRFDGWTDKFRYDLWLEAFNDTGIDMDFFTVRKRDVSEPLPWDHINMGITKEFLKDELKKALKGELTKDCRDGSCNTCGVCDFEKIEPRVYPVDEINGNSGKSRKKPENKKENNTIIFEVSYSKKGPAKYLGHLEMVSIFLRALRRARFPLLYSKGFHPMPKVAFNDPLPIGMESRKEVFYMSLTENLDPSGIPELINSGLPDGLRILSANIAPLRSKRKNKSREIYEIEIRAGIFDKTRLESFMEKDSHLVRRINKKGKVKYIDLKEVVSRICIVSDRKMELEVKNIEGKKVRPFEIIKEVFMLHPDIIKSANIIKF